LTEFEGEWITIAPSTDDERIRTIARGVVKGAGPIGNPLFPIVFWASSAALGATASAPALFEIGSELYVDAASNLGTWQTFTPEAYNDAVDIITNAVPGVPSITGPGSGAVIGTLLGTFWDIINGKRP
jgi:hypothetical protein